MPRFMVFKCMVQSTPTGRTMPRIVKSIWLLCDGGGSM